jgi:hypothetical protein
VVAITNNQLLLDKTSTVRGEDDQAVKEDLGHRSHYQEELLEPLEASGITISTT